MLTKRSLLSLSQYLQLQPWGNVVLLLEKHGIIQEMVEPTPGRELEFLRLVLSDTIPEAVLSLLSEVARTHGNMRNRVSPRYEHDERWEDLWACLALEGFRRSDSQLVRDEPAIEGSVAIEDDLTQQLNESSLAEAADIVRCIENSAEDFRKTPPDFVGCLTNARVALQTLATAVSRRYTDSRPQSFDESKWGQVLSHLRTCEFITQKEEEGLSGVFSFVSPGSHKPIGLSETEMTRLGRNLVTGMCYFLIKRFNT